MIQSSRLFTGDNNDHLVFINRLVKKRCGLKFDQLTEEEEIQLTGFLENQTVGNP